MHVTLLIRKSEEDTFQSPYIENLLPYSPSGSTVFSLFLVPRTLQRRYIYSIETEAAPGFTGFNIIGS